MNYGEGEQLSKKMDGLGYTRVNTVDDADIVILNTCTVVETTEKNMIHRMVDLKQRGKEVIVTGCMSKIQPNIINICLSNPLIIPPDNYDHFENLVKKTFGYSKPFDIKTECVSAIIPIAQGCLGNCSYCITRFARGSLKSYDEKELSEEFNNMLNNGAKEILITAQDTACYGMDIGTTLPHLIKEFLKNHGDYRIRIGMMNPNNFEKIVDDLVDVMKDERVYKFLHIPVQSGSNNVLERMKRHYTAEKFMDMISKLREEIPDISISTDMITGFPGETDDDHKKSIELLKQLRADTVNITRFSIRPGTIAASMDNQIQGNIIKNRSTELTKIKMDIGVKINKTMIGKTFHVLVTENGKNGTVIARTNSYRPIGLKEDVKLGTFLDVEITDSTPFYLTGKIVKH